MFQIVQKDHNQVSSPPPPPFPQSQPRPQLFVIPSRDCRPTGPYVWVCGSSFSYLTVHLWNHSGHSLVAQRVKGCDTGCSCSADCSGCTGSSPGLGTSACHGHSQKKEKSKENHPVLAQVRPTSVLFSGSPEHSIHQFNNLPVSTERHLSNFQSVVNMNTETIVCIHYCIYIHFFKYMLLR